MKDLMLLRNNISTETAIGQHVDRTFESENEAKIIFTWLYLGYKTVLSSQDGNNCMYYPSCSTYAIRSIEKKGLFAGIVAAFDRLTRCHPFAVKNYPVYVDKKRLYDPVDKKALEVSENDLQYLPGF